MDYRYTPKGQTGDIFMDYMGVGETVEPECRDVLRIFIRTKREIVTEIGYTINENACMLSRICAAAACELVRGKPVLEAYLLSARDIGAAVGGIPEAGRHCALMAELSLKRAIVNYAGNRQ